jgi:5-methylcytosine-specific restriction endonuclease McrA
LYANLFAKDSSRGDGLQPYCKACRKQYKIDNKEKIQKQSIKYYNTNKSKILKNQKNAYLNGRYKYHSLYYEQNKESILENRKNYRKANIEKITMGKQTHYKNHIEDYKMRSKKYFQNNKDVFRKAYHKRKSREMSVLATLTIEEWDIIKKDFNYKCAYCGEEKPLAQEHFIPLVKGGEYTSDNIIPACKNCNSSKKQSDFFKWYPRQPYYSKSREKFILEYLNYFGTQAIKE